MSSTIIEFDFSPDSPPAIVGRLATNKTVTIELWENGAIVTHTSNVCTEIGETGKYTWSTGNIAVLTASRQQFHWRMSDGTNTDEGDFVLISRENRDSGMPSLTDKSSYISQV